MSRQLWPSCAAWWDIASGHVEFCLEGDELEVGKGLRQGDPASPIMWNVVLDAALAPACIEWQRKQQGVPLSVAAIDGRGRTPRNTGDAARPLAHLAYADHDADAGPELIVHQRPGRTPARRDRVIKGWRSMALPCIGWHGVARGSRI